jgi:hypothetical protein
MENYVVNDQLKRIEPIATLCQFCNKRHSEKMDRNVFIPLFNVQDRTNIIIYSSVKYKKVLVGIPRCNHCYVIHKKSAFYSWLISIPVGIAMAITGFSLWGLYGVFSLMISIVIAAVSPILITDILIKKQHILTQKDGGIKDPMVQDLVLAGWSINPPMAR